jgi:PAS domain S-box-containing protein
MKMNLKKPDKYDVLKIIAIYAIFSCLWIYFSDTALSLFMSDQATLIRISVFKGFFFVIITSLLLYQLVSRYLLESRQLKEMIKKNELLFGLLSESMRDAFVSVDMIGKVLQYNEVYRAMLGYEAEELLSKTYIDLTPEKWHLMERKIIEEQVILIGYSDIYEKEYRRKDGSVFPVELRTQLIRDDQGNPYVMWAIVRDITARKRTEEALQKLNDELEKRIAKRTADLEESRTELKRQNEELRKTSQALEAETAALHRAMEDLREKDQLVIQQNRMAAMGEMLGNIAHQWRQPFNVLGLIVQDLGLSYENGELNQELLDSNISKVMEILLHLSQTIDDFSYFATPDKEKAHFKVDQIIVKTISLIEESFKNNHIVIDISSSDDPQINGYPHEYAQVLLNILMNARDAFLESRRDNAQITVRAWKENDRSVVTITDNAGGIKTDILGKIFEPYFTTKDLGKGTGVGLFMAKTIIEKNMGGCLSARNTGDGVEFRIEV